MYVIECKICVVVEEGSKFIEKLSKPGILTYQASSIAYQISSKIVTHEHNYVLSLSHANKSEWLNIHIFVHTYLLLYKRTTAHTLPKVGTHKFSFSFNIFLSCDILINQIFAPIT